MVCRVGIILCTLYNKTINNNNMLGIGDNFDYQGKKPNFARDCFSTLEKMKSYPETSIDPGHISFCGEDGKLYQYLPDNEVNEVTGKWRRLVDSILDANSENPVQNKVVVKKISDLEKLIAGSAEKVKGDIDLDIETMGGIIAAGMVDLNRNMDELEEAVSEALNSLNAGHVSLEEIKVNGHPITSSVNLNSTDIGLGNVDNTRDLDKPISTRVSAALNEKVDKSIKVNNKSLAQDVVIEKSDIGLGRVDNTGDMEKPVSNAVQQALDDKVSKVPGKDLVEDADIAKLKQLRTREELDELVKTVLQTLKTVGETHTARKDNPHNVTKDQVGLGSVDDTSDLDKPISRAVQEALDNKVNIDNLDYIYDTLNELESKHSTLKYIVDELEPITNTLNKLVVNENSYGVEINYATPTVKYTPIGNPKLHETLPIQNKMRPCILDSHGTVVKYLPIDSGWVESDVNGNLGQVMVEIPEFWYKLENTVSSITIQISEKKLSGFSRRALSYISAYNATIDRNVAFTNRGEDFSRGLRSVCSSDHRYKGGIFYENNLKRIYGVEGNEDSNRRDDPDIYKQTFLGKPFYEFNLENNSRTVDKNSMGHLSIEDRWHSLDYPTYLTIFFLYVTEFKNVDLVEALNINDLEETFSPFDESQIEKYPSEKVRVALMSTISPKYIGDTNSIGGGSGVIQKTYGERKYLSIRYRGIENLVGDVPYAMLGVKFQDVSYDSKSNNLEITMPDLSVSRSYIDNPDIVSGAFVNHLKYGIIGIPKPNDLLFLSNNNGLKSTFSYFLSGKVEFDKRSIFIFGAVSRTVYNKTFNYIVKCKPSYLTVGVTGMLNYVNTGTRLCCNPEGKELPGVLPDPA